MTSEIQGSNFTHGKCLNCGHIALIDKFDQHKNNEVKSEGEFGTMDMYQLVLKCPICGDEFCEAVFPNEVN